MMIYKLLFVGIRFRLVFSITVLFLLLIIYASMLGSRAIAQTNNNNDTSFFLNAIQDASPNDDRYLKAKVTVRGLELNADLAVTQEQMSKGLAVKDELKENESMLFVFGEPSRHSFWMKDMKFPIDIIWLDNNGTVVYIKNSLQPCIMTFAFLCPTYTPDKDSLYVLETGSGFSKKHGIKIGTHADFQLIS